MSKKNKFLSVTGLLSATILLIVACSGANPRSFPNDTTRERADPVALDQYVERVQRDWNVPGMAVAMVRGDSVVLAKGYGLRRIDGEDRVNADTVFQCASLTKPFVAVAAAALAAQGRWSLEDRVESRLPSFRMADEWVTHEFRIRDLMAHRSGFATFEGDLLWFYSDLDDAAILQHLGALRPRYGFRSRFGYCNLMFMVAARAMQSVVGVPWPDHVRRTLFEPLHMDRTVLGAAVLRRLTNVASPHAMAQGGPRPIDPYPSENLGAAGALDSSVNDLAKWLRLLVNDGRFEGRQIVPAEALHETWKPHSIIPVYPVDHSEVLAGLLSAMNPSLRSAYYGLGWALLDHRGERVIMHGGQLPGSTAALGFVPGRGGVVVLANTEDPTAVHAVLFRALDELLGLEPIDWSAALQRATPPPPLSRPSGPAASASARSDLVGHYVSAEYGAAEVRREGDTLTLHLEHHSTMSGALVLVEGDQYSCSWSNPQMLGADLAFTRAGNAVSGFELTSDVFSDPHKYTFTRTP
jgi:CubicO group peptidase (beta-lactamase class C family)